MFGLPIGLIVTVIDIALIVHAAKTGRFMPWGFIILFLPGIGALAYVVVEIVPQWLGSAGVRRAGQNLAAALDPERRYREAKEQLAIVDTIANRAALAEAALSLGKFDEARALYAAIVVQPLGDEPSFMLGRARAEFGLGEAATALATLAELKTHWPQYQAPDADLLYGRALEAAGRVDEALAAYAAVAGAYPGQEPRLRRAELLIRLGRGEEGRALAAEIARDLRRSPPHVRRAQSRWLAAADKLARR